MDHQPTDNRTDRERNRQYNTNNTTNSNSTHIGQENSIQNNTEMTSNHLDSTMTLPNDGRSSTDQINDFDFGQQLFKMYLIGSNNISTIHTIKSILLSATTPASSSSPPPTSLSAEATTKKLNFQHFFQLCFEYVGMVVNYPKGSNGVISNIQFTFDQDDMFTINLLHAALLTNSPTIIDDVLSYMDIDFTILNIPQNEDYILLEKNSIYQYSTSPINHLLRAIVLVTQDGHYESILYLINNHGLSPTITICDADPHGNDLVQFNNLFFYASKSNNIKLIEYFIPLCYPRSDYVTRQCSLWNIAENGLLPLIKKFHTELNLNLLKLCDRRGYNLLYKAVRSGNIELIDYLIDVVGFDPHQNESYSILYSALSAHQWYAVQHLITKYQFEIRRDCFQMPNIINLQHLTTDLIDFIFTTFHIKGETLDEGLYHLVQQGNIIGMKHLIQNHNINLYSFFLLILKANPSNSIEMIECLQSEFGVDINQLNDDGISPIQNVKSVSVFKSLLEHKAIIRDMNNFIQEQINSGTWSIVQYLFETQPHININQFKATNDLPLLHYVICNEKDNSLDFIRFLLSTNQINIHEKNDTYNSPIYYATLDSIFNFDVIKLLIQHGATISKTTFWQIIHSLIQHRYLKYKLYHFFQFLDYCQDKFGYYINQFSFPDNNYGLSESLLLSFTSKPLDFVDYIMKHQATNRHIRTIIYRALIHRYKANVNKQHQDTGNTLFHHLVQHNQVQLIPFTIMHSDQFSNIHYVNNKNETFLHLLLFDWCKNERVEDYYDDIDEDEDENENENRNNEEKQNQIG